MIIMNGCSYLAPDIIDDNDYKNVGVRPSNKEICRNCKWYCSDDKCLMWNMGKWLDIYDMVK